MEQAILQGDKRHKGLWNQLLDDVTEDREHNLADMTPTVGCRKESIPASCCASMSLPLSFTSTQYPQLYMGLSGDIEVISCNICHNAWPPLTTPIPSS